MSETRIREPDLTQAWAEGWTLSYSEGGERNEWQIQYLHDSDRFTDDLSAWQLITREARNGSAYHLAAIDFIRKYSPHEFEKFCRFTGWTECPRCDGTGTDPPDGGDCELCE